MANIEDQQALNRKGRKGLAKRARFFLAPFATPSRAWRLKAFGVSLLIAAAALSAAQSTHTTVRHHKVEDQDPAISWLNEAETDIAKQDFAAAEPLLKKYLETYPESY